MLRAITGYFFGGAVKEAPQTTVECDTREVNDWLVVNMADRPEDDVDMDDVDMDDVVEVDLTDNEYDEILDAVSCLMRTDEFESDGSFLDENCSETEEIDSQTWSKSDESFSDESDIDDRIPISLDFNTLSQYAFPTESLDLNFKESVLNMEPLPFINLEMLRRSHNFNLPREVVQSFQTYDRTCFMARPKPATVQVAASSMNSYKYPSDGLQDYKKAVKVFRSCESLSVHHAQMNYADSEFLKLMFQYPKSILQRLKDSRCLLKSRLPDMTCHPMYSKTYVNHRHPGMSPKTDLMQKIKELEQEQQAQDYKTKKFISKGQLNRQNKNYIFDSSSKKNRRKNLQRRPSGANNNRKC